MSFNNPTPNKFWWFKDRARKSWGLYYVQTKQGGGLEAKIFKGSNWLHVDKLDGEWQRIPNSDEMQEAWAVKCPAGQYAHVGTEDECIDERDRLNDADMFLAGQEYTCKPVYIVRREIEVEG